MVSQLLIRPKPTAAIPGYARLYVLLHILPHTTWRLIANSDRYETTWAMVSLVTVVTLAATLAAMNMHRWRCPQCPWLVRALVKSVVSSAMSAMSAMFNCCVRVAKQHQHTKQEQEHEQEHEQKYRRSSAGG